MATLSPWQRPLAPAACDVAVVGGGVTGAATAYALAQMQPGLRIALVEAETLAFGASGRNAGFLLLGTHADYASAVDAYGRETARRVWAFTAETLREASALPGVGFAPVGSTLAAGTPDEAARLVRSQELMAEDGVVSEWSAESPAGTRGLHGALHVPEGGVVDPVRLVRHLATTSRADVHEHTPVERVEPGPAGVRVVFAGGGAVEAGRVLLATNAWLPALVPGAGAVVRPVRAQMLATAPVAPALPVPVYSHEGYFYVRQTPDGRVLIGGARHLHLEAEVGLDDATTPALQADLEAFLRAHVPAAAGAAVERRWSGPMGFSPDSLPALGSVPGVPGAVFAAGFTGHGMAYSLRFGRLAARRLLGEPDEAADLFDAGRLAVSAENPASSPAAHAS